jgi:hypothetical protein
VSAKNREPYRITRRQVIEGGAAFAVLGYARPGFAAEVEPLAPPARSAIRARPLGLFA